MEKGLCWGVSATYLGDQNTVPSFSLVWLWLLQLFDDSIYAGIAKCLATKWRSCSINFLKYPCTLEWRSEPNLLFFICCLFHILWQYSNQTWNTHWMFLKCRGSGLMTWKIVSLLHTHYFFFHRMSVELQVFSMCRELSSFLTEIEMECIWETESEWHWQPDSWWIS